MQIAGIAQQGVYRQLNGHLNGQVAARLSTQEAAPLQAAQGAGTKAKLAELEQARQAALTGPADAAKATLGPQYMRRIIQQRLEDLQAGHLAAGPRPVSEMTAQNGYRMALNSLR
ncbi:hypothetical protein [Phaeobacter sp.]|uniref:hypothetical protein n=1 Tax=Phaeobacter sp. TaxID=1902409 RepID=UPI0025EC21EA|nr:hypothetical protein [Phaeobacter sp.]